MWWWSQLIWQSVRADHNSYRIFYRFFPGDVTVTIPTSICAPIYQLILGWEKGRTAIGIVAMVSIRNSYFGSIEPHLIHWGEVLCRRFKDGRHGRIGWCFCCPGPMAAPLPRTNTMARCGRGTSALWNHCRIRNISRPILAWWIIAICL